MIRRRICGFSEHFLPGILRIGRRCLTACRIDLHTKFQAVRVGSSDLDGDIFDSQFFGLFIQHRAYLVHRNAGFIPRIFLHNTDSNIPFNIVSNTDNGAIRIKTYHQRCDE